MHTFLHHRYNGINGGHKRRTFLGGEQFGTRHHQVSACRESHCSHFRGVYAQFSRKAPYHGQGLLEVGLRIGVSDAPKQVSVSEHKGWRLCRSVFQQEGRYAVCLQPFCHTASLGIHIVPEIASARAYNDGNVRPALGRVGCQPYLLVAGSALPDIYPGKAGCCDCRKQYGK